MSTAGVSVVIPVRNRPLLLRRALESVLRQTRPVDEIVVVDDASSDETAEVALTLAAKDPRIRLLRQPVPGGACRTRNRGIEAARGAFVAFLDSDDEWEAGKIEAQMAALAAHPGAVACFTGVRHVSGDRTTAVRLPPRRVGLAELEIANVLGSTSSALVRIDALVAAGMFDPAMVSCQDWDLYLRLAPLGSLVTLREALTVYDDGDHGRISRNIAAVLAGHREIARKMLARQSDAGARARLRRLHAFKQADLMAVVGRRPWRALGLGALALRRDPGPASAVLLGRLAYRAAKVGIGLA